ncbi:g8158 [Coccomyxa elongata]
MPAAANLQVDNLRRALQGLKATSQERVSNVEKLAKEQAAGAGESDLRRLRRQFSSLKNTFMLYHTKEHFIDGLLDDLPDGSEERKLQGLEEQVQSQGAKVKTSKKHNAKIQEDIANLIAQIADTMQELEEEERSALAQLDEVEAEPSTSMHGDQSLPPIEEDMSEADCEAGLASETAKGRHTEAATAAQEAEITELLAAIKSEEQEVQALRHQVEQMRASAQQQKDGQVAPERFGEAAEWCSEVTALMQSLSGVSILRIEEDEILLGLTTHAHPGSGLDPGAPVTRWDHELMLMLEPGKSDLADASLRPADVEISDIAAAAEGSARSLEYMVREVHARLADRLSQAVGPQGHDTKQVDPPLDPANT